jgi:predicted MPP superfamily phosphohydrolase
MISTQLAFLLFFMIALTITGSVNYYIIRRGWQCLPDKFRLKRAYLVIAVFWAFSYLTGRVLEHWSPGWMSGLLIWTGSSWIGFMSYFFLILIPLDLIRLLNFWFRFFPDSWSVNPHKTRMITGGIIFGVVALANLYGYFNACQFRLKPVDIAIAKSAGDLKKMKIVFVSDIHLGTVVGPSRFGRMVDMINSQNPDLVLIGGDLVDEGLHSEKNRDIHDILKRLRSGYGTYAVTGNHELIVGIDNSEPFITGAGIRLLRDEAVTVNGSFILAGRDDFETKRFTGFERKPLPAILQGTDKNLPIILMDHTPYRLEEAERAGVDLQLSGHTHNGQFWPFNYITGMIFEQDWGYWRRGDTQYYVSCGAGVWGPPIRIGSYPEIVVVDVRFGDIDR